VIRLALEQRAEVPRGLRLLRPALSLVLALLLGALFLLAAGGDPLELYGVILHSAFLNLDGLSDTLVKATPILLAGLGVALAFQMRLWNIGAEGQLLMGAWAATGVALRLLPPATPRPVMLLSMMLAAFAAGAVWAGAAGWLRARRGVSEIVTTLMMNYMALYLLRYFIHGPWSERGFSLTPQLPPSAWLPRLAPYSVHLGLAFALLCAGLLSFVLSRSRFGYELRVIGGSERAARYAGMDVPRRIVLTMLLSGGLVGLAGMSEVAGVVHRLQERFSPGFGTMGVIVAFLARKRPLPMVLVAILFGGLLCGGKQIQPAGIPHMLEGILLFVFVGTEVLVRYRLRVFRAP
jgi:simple sugar transport system permease protein